MMPEQNIQALLERASETGARRALARLGLDDPSAAKDKPYVHFYATKRLGGAVTNSEAIKVMKFAAA